jgi:Family of unknown function (DUF6489)
VKINIDLDCTPDKAREFFGLPKIKPTQQPVMASVERQMLDAAPAMSPAAVLKMWFPHAPEPR